jgi:hypothetical protein
MRVLVAVVFFGVLAGAAVAILGSEAHAPVHGIQNKRELIYI